MRDFHTDVDIQAPPHVVWTIMRDVERWSDWTLSVTSIRILGGGPLAVGSRAIVRQPKLLPARWQVTELDQQRHSFTWESGMPGMRVIGRHWVEALDTGSRAKLSLQFSGLFGGMLAGLLRDLNERYLAMEARGLKARSESAAFGR